MHPKQIIDSVVINDPKMELPPIARTEARVFLLYRFRVRISLAYIVQIMRKEFVDYSKRSSLTKVCNIIDVYC